MCNVNSVIGNMMVAYCICKTILKFNSGFSLLLDNILLFHLVKQFPELYLEHVKEFGKYSTK